MRMISWMPRIETRVESFRTPIHMLPSGGIEMRNGLGQNDRLHRLAAGEPEGQRRLALPDRDRLEPALKISARFAP